MHNILIVYKTLTKFHWEIGAFVIRDNTENVWLTDIRKKKEIRIVVGFQVSREEEEMDGILGRSTDHPGGDLSMDGKLAQIFILLYKL